MRDAGKLGTQCAGKEGTGWVGQNGLRGHLPRGLHPVAPVLSRHVWKKGMWASKPGDTNPFTSPWPPVKGQGTRTLPHHLVAKHPCRYLLLQLLGVPRLKPIPGADRTRLGSGELVGPSFSPSPVVLTRLLPGSLPPFLSPCHVTRQPIPKGKCQGYDT